MEYRHLKSLLLGIILTISVPNSFAQDASYKIVFQNLDWAPDGQRIAFTAIKVKSDWSDYSADKWGLFLYNIETKSLQQLASGALYFSFSPDGKKLAYDKSTDKNADIYVLDLGTKETIKLIGHEAKDRAPSWSADGTSLVFYSDRDGHEELYSINVKKGKITQLTNRDEYKSYNPIWAAHSDLIVYYLEKGDSRDQIYLTDMRGSFHANLTNDGHHNIYPSWTPDGKIIYVRDKGEIMIMNSDGTGKEQLSEMVGDQISMSPDGKQLLISKGDGNLYLEDLADHVAQLVISGSEIYDEQN